MQAIGHTLSEQRLLDPGTGAVLTQTLDAYKLPTIADVPEIVCEFVDVPDAHLTNLGSKGLGEPPIIPTAAAIANAIRDATGADVRSLPITREEMLPALARARAGRRRRLELLRPESVEEAVSALGQRRASPSAAAPSSSRSCATGSSRPTRSSSCARAVRRGVDGHAASARHDARRARGRPGDPGRAARGLPALRVAAAPGDGHDRRQPAARPRAAGTGGSRSRATCTAATAAMPGRASTASTRSSATSRARPRIRRIRRQRCSRSARASAPTGASSIWPSSTACRPTTTAI